MSDQMPQPPQPNAVPPQPVYPDAAYTGQYQMPGGYEQTGSIPTFSPDGQLPPGYQQMPQAPMAPKPPSQFGIFIKSLLDVNFHTFITRKVAKVVYIIGLILIGVSALGMLFTGLVSAVAAMGSSYTSGFGVLMLFVTLIGVPVAAFFSVLLLRVGTEMGIALVATAENTERIANNTDPNNAS